MGERESENLLALSIKLNAFTCVCVWVEQKKGKKIFSKEKNDILPSFLSIHFSTLLVATLPSYIVNGCREEGEKSTEGKNNGFKASAIPYGCL